MKRGWEVKRKEYLAKEKSKKERNYLCDIKKSNDDLIIPDKFQNTVDTNAIYALAKSKELGWEPGESEIYSCSA